MKKVLNEKEINLWKMVGRVLPQIFSVSPVRFILNCLLFVVDGAFFVISILCMQVLFDSVVDLSLNKGTINNCLWALVFLFLIKIFEQILNGITYFLAESYDRRCVGKLSFIVNDKIGKLNPIYFEDVDILNDINKSYEGINYAIQFVNTFMDLFTVYIPYFLFMGLYMFRLKPSLAFAIILIFLPVLLTQFLRVKVFSKLEDISAPLRRKKEYYENCLVDREYLKETRTLGASLYFIKKFKEALLHLNFLQWKADKKTNLIEFGMKIITLIGYLGVLWMFFRALMNREITVGAFAAIFAAMDNMFSMMEEIVCGRLGSYAKYYGKIINYLRFLSLPTEKEEKTQELKEPLSKGISLVNVSFSYPKSERKAVKEINLRISKGETIAIVGENGSGKSTLVRLIVGLYSPNEGKIMYDGKDIKEMLRSQLFKATTGVFQKYQKYQLTLAENIKISDLLNTEKKDLDLEKARLKAGFNLEPKKFINGYDTMLSRAFGGIDLSGGEWQRVAIARGFYREHEIIILDEPTSAIDPLEEGSIYEKFSRMTENKTSIIITHRLGSVKLADRIVLMDDGKIVNVGTHKKLLAIEPLYKKMWESQSKYYNFL